MQDRSDVGPVGCRTDEMQEKWDARQLEYRTGGIHEGWDAGQVGCNHAGQVEYRRGDLQDR